MYTFLIAFVGVLMVLLFICACVSVYFHYIVFEGGLMLFPPMPPPMKKKEKEEQ